MRFPMTKVAEAKKIVEASPDRLFFVITEDAAFLQAMEDSAGIVAPVLDHRANTFEQTVVVIDLRDQQWSQSLMAFWMRQTIDFRKFAGKSVVIVGSAEQAKTYAIRQAITMWV